MNTQTMTIRDKGARTARTLVIAAALVLGLAMSAEAQISVNIGFNLGVYPNLVVVPGYPVYYDPQAEANYFYYGDSYWVFRNDNWYSSGWYNGPWQMVDSYNVPLYVLRVPVGYYRQPPAYFGGWGRDAPPHWGEHYGNDWQQRRAGWDQWNHGSNPAPAPLPAYQRDYPKDRYPATVAQQRTIQSNPDRTEAHPAASRQAAPQHTAAMQQPAASPSQHETAQSRSSAERPQAQAHPEAQRARGQPDTQAPQQRPAQQHPVESQPQQHAQQRPAESQPQQHAPRNDGGERQSPAHAKAPANEAEQHGAEKNNEGGHPGHEF